MFGNFEKAIALLKELGERVLQELGEAAAKVDAEAQPGDPLVNHLAGKQQGVVAARLLLEKALADEISAYEEHMAGRCDNAPLSGDPY